MDYRLFQCVSFWCFLLDIDRELAATAKQQGCPCGGRLHGANYPRKPRGGSQDVPEEFDLRFSFCCDREGCRKRLTPPSVRFLGRKVYLAAVVILVAAMRQGSSPRRLKELRSLFGDLDHRTIARWRVFWTEHFPKTPFWRAYRGRLMPVPSAAELPLALWEAFLDPADHQESWGRLLRFLSPISIAGGPSTRRRCSWRVSAGANMLGITVVSSLLRWRCDDPS